MTDKFLLVMSDVPSTVTLLLIAAAEWFGIWSVEMHAELLFAMLVVS